MKKKRKYTIYTDGSYSKSYGGAGVIIEEPNYYMKAFTGFTANNSAEAELTAIVLAIQAIPDPSEILIKTDYLEFVQIMKNKELTQIKKNNWKKKGGKKKQIQNIKLWKKILQLEKIHKISVTWTNTHKNIKVCHKLANNARIKKADEARKNLKN